MSLEQDLEQYLEQYLSQLAANHSHTKLAVACSAGIDSLSLLTALQALVPNLYCLHLDHGLRADSHKAREFLQEYCKAHNIYFIVKELKAGEIKNSEESARAARYDFFKAACHEHNMANLFLAHNLNDQAETILFRIIRGTSTNGLQGIPVTRELGEGITIHRPLLKTPRSSIEAYAKTKNLSFIEDSSNEDLKYARNRIRKTIMPEAETINPQCLSNIQTLSELVGEEQEFINSASEDALLQLGDLPWQLDKFRSFPKALQRKILERSFTTNIAFLSDFIDAIKQGGFHRINFTKNKYFTIKQKQIYLEDGKQPAKIIDNDGSN